MLVRYDWNLDEVLQIFSLPFNDLLYKAHCVLRESFGEVNKIEACSLVNIKSGKCPENCKYCPQSAHYNVDIKEYREVSTEDVAEQVAKAAKRGVRRVCMGAAWRSVSDNNLDYVVRLINIVKRAGMEACATLGMASVEQLTILREAGLDYYNHNIDTSEEYYKEVVTTRKYSDRIKTVNNIKEAGLRVCCGGIVGMGESRKDRAAMIKQLSSFVPHPQSVPINMLVPVEGVPFQDMPPLDEIEFVRTVAVTRIVLCQSVVRLSAGRSQMSDSMQALCFFAGANSLFHGDKLLTVNNSTRAHDEILLDKLGMEFA